MPKAPRKTKVGKKIGKLIREGKPLKRAVGQALNMEREGRIGPKGGLKRKKRST